MTCFLALRMILLWFLMQATWLGHGTAQREVRKLNRDLKNDRERGGAGGGADQVLHSQLC